MRLKFSSLVTLCLISSLFSLQPLQPRAVPETLKVSLIIPCHHLHFDFLPQLLQAYLHQLDPRDEIVISLSGAELVSQQLLKHLEQRNWPFCLKIVKTVGRKDASENRNIASAHSTGDLLIYQDADDLPHRHRVKVLRYLFENFEIDLLLHQYDFQVIANPKPVLLDQVANACHLFNEWAEHEILYYVQHGSPALRRYVWESVQWEQPANTAEDTWFNWRAAQKFPHRAILFLPLIAYRPQHSAWNR